MTDCIDAHTIVITLTVVTHGSMISTSLTPDQQAIMSDTRLFSLSGGFDDVMCWDSLLENYAGNVNKVFREDLDQGSYTKMKDYSMRVKPKYVANLRMLFDALANTNVCTIYQNITVDKMFGVTERPSNKLGIFVAAVHEKEDGILKLKYPPHTDKTDTMNLLDMADFRRFAGLFGTSLPVQLFSDIGDDILRMGKSGTTVWIEQIRMSYLVYVIKKIVSQRSDIEQGIVPCKINIFDYSCSSLRSPESIGQTSMNELQYMQAEDEETGVPKWGGQG